VQMKTKDVTTFASGLQANVDESSSIAVLDPKESKIQNFYANMIDCTDAAAISERDRRKERQKQVRLKTEEDERQRAIQEAMMMLNVNNDDDNADDAGDNSSNNNKTTTSVASMMEQSTDKMMDCHLSHFDLPNLRGGGPDLLTNANLTLGRGRRYGLMGRNGCGKTTLLTFLATRQIPKAIPKNMNMLLVRQEIIGDDHSAVETVLKSDVKRESVKRFIQYCEEQLDKLEHPEKYNNADSQKAATAAAAEDSDAVAANEVHGGGGSGGAAMSNNNSNNKSKTDSNKSKQKLRDRKANRMQKAARQKVQSSSSSTTTAGAVNDQSKMRAILEQQKTEWAAKLAKAYEHLQHVEEMEGGDPEPRARKVLAGLGFVTPEMQDKATAELSGGWRMRVALSCALFANPSLLLLDEPTNREYLLLCILNFWSDFFIDAVASVCFSHSCFSLASSLFRFVC
jgi:ABC-type glutathione transport system ATPase component